MTKLPGSCVVNRLLVTYNVGYDKFISRFPISNFICCVEMNKGYIRQMEWRHVLLSSIKLQLKNRNMEYWKKILDSYILDI